METSALTIRKFDLDELQRDGVEPEYVAKSSGPGYFLSLQVVYERFFIKSDCLHCKPPINLKGEGAIRLDYRLSWVSPMRTLAVEQGTDCTAQAACAVSLLVVKHETEFDVAGSSEKGTGVDFVLCLKTRTPDERKAQVEDGRNRLTTHLCDGLMEVSGTTMTDPKEGKDRLREKVRQMLQNPPNKQTTCLAVVVDFWHSVVRSRRRKPKIA